MWIDGPRKARQKSQLWRNLVLAGALSVLLTVIVLVLLWFSLVSSLIHGISPETPLNGLQSVISNWKHPDDLNASIFTQLSNFTRGIYPVPCHSHNDYWRKVPLLQAISVGCTSVEADLWLAENASDLLVGHSKKSLRNDYTLQSLYLDPIHTILTHQNTQSGASIANASLEASGVFETRPDLSLVLLLDLKTNGSALWPVIQRQLRPLREQQWLTFWDHETGRVTPRPVTVVLSGDAPFDLVTTNSSYRDVFYDAPLDDVENDKYTIENSYYASASFRNSLHYSRFSAIKGARLDTLRKQIQAASRKGLVSRYWDTPSWPASLRSDIWRLLVTNGVGVLSVDEVVEATRWDWRWCQLAGFGLCK